MKKGQLETLSTPHGWVIVDGQWRPFKEYREISRGKQKGSFEVQLCDSKRVVSANLIKRFPSEV